MVAGSLSKRSFENKKLIEKIKIAYEKGRKTYVSPRIHKELQKAGERCSRKRVARLMRIEKLQAKMRKKWKVSTKSNPKAVPAPNHLNQIFITEKENQVWVSDITYIKTREGWLYVAITLDLFSRKIVGMNMEESLETSLVAKALKQAICAELGSRGVDHSSSPLVRTTSWSR